jgi:hypothetical protein
MPVQRLAYRLLSQVIAQDIPRLVIEVEASTTDLDEVHSLPKLSPDLIAVLNQTSLGEWDESNMIVAVSDIV